LYGFVFLKGNEAFFVHGFNLTTTSEPCMAQRSVFGSFVLTFLSQRGAWVFVPIPDELWKAHVAFKKGVGGTKANYRVNGHSFEAAVQEDLSVAEDTTVWLQRNTVTGYHRHIYITSCFWLGPQVKHLSGAGDGSKPTSKTTSKSGPPSAIPWLVPSSENPLFVTTSEEFPSAAPKPGTPGTTSGPQLVSKATWSRMTSAHLRGTRVTKVPPRLLAAWQWVGPVPDVLLSKPWLVVERLVNKKDYMWGFHGTTEPEAKSIFRDGFDERRMGSNGSHYGRGAYLANNPLVACEHGTFIVVCLILGPKRAKTTRDPVLLTQSMKEMDVVRYRGGAAAVIFPPHHKRRIFSMAVVRANFAFP
jgi:hypothetical protein